MSCQKERIKGQMEKVKKVSNILLAKPPTIPAVAAERVTRGDSLNFAATPTPIAMRL